MKATDAIRQRRSIRTFTDRTVRRSEIEHLLDTAVLAPNHRLTQPWRFYVLGREARAAWGAALGQRKALKKQDPESARQVREKVTAEHAELPAMIVVAMVQDANPEIREEDYASVMMAVQNISIAAAEMGLGTHIKSGAIMEDPAARAAAGVGVGERIVATVNVGEPADLPSRKDRTPAAAFTKWLP